jgi:flagellar FlgN protein
MNDAAIDKLQANLREELAVRRRLLEAEVALAEAVRGMAAADVLGARVEAVRLLTSETSRLSQERVPVVTELTRSFALPPDASLRDVCGRLSPERAEPLRTLREDLRTVLLETQLRVRADAVLLRQALDLVSTLVHVIAGAPDSPQSYESAGQLAPPASGPLLFDTAC